MTARLPLRRERSTVPNRRSLAALFTTLLTEVGSNSQHLFADCLGRFDAGGERYWLPRFIFRGDRAEAPPIKLGVFAGVHGDEIAGVLAALDFLRLLEAQPDFGRAYHIYVYPVCNPTGFEDGTRHARTGLDLNREFWRESQQPEVRMLEAEIARQRFDGIVSLHSDDTSDGLYGFVRGATLTEHLLKPALVAAEAALPLNEAPIIDGFHAIQGVIHTCYQGVLSAPPDAHSAPFEIILESPQHAPIALQRQATVLALREIVRHYRRLISFAANI
jgi:hypothetical protein